MPAIEYARLEYFHRTSGEYGACRSAINLRSCSVVGNSNVVQCEPASRGKPELCVSNSSIVIGASSASAGVTANHGRCFGDRIVEPQQAALAQLHDRRCGKQLAVRRHAELGLRRHRCLAGDVGKSEPLRPDQFLIGDDADGDPGQVPREHLAFEPRREQALTLPGHRRRPQRPPAAPAHGWASWRRSAIASGSPIETNQRREKDMAASFSPSVNAASILPP